MMDTPYDFGPPIDTDMSMDFNYDSWSPNTELLLTNVPWNADYRDIVQMDNLAALNAWLESKPNVRYRNASTQKFGNGIIKVDLPQNEAMKYNYIRARNGLNPVSSVMRDYFYFVTGIAYGAPNTTVLSVQLDVVTTFLYEVTFGQSYIERGHIGIANQNAFNAFGREYLTVPEGLDLGGEYRTVHVEFEQIMATNATDILVCSTLDLTQDPGTVDNPSIKSATGSNFQGLPSGASFYLFPTIGDLLRFFQSYSDKPWITQSIMTIQMIPDMNRYYPNYDYGPNLSTVSNVTFYGWSGGQPAKHVTKMLPGWRNADFIGNILGPAYSKLLKFLTYPYMTLELTTFTGSPIVIKPESWQDADATIVEMSAMLPPGQRIAIMPRQYNWDPETASGSQDTDLIDDFGDFLDFAVHLSDFPQLPVVNNSAIAFLANNKHGLAFSFSSADWTQQRALAGVQAGADVATAQIGNTARQSSIANRTQTDTTSMAAQQQVLSSIVGAGASIPGIAASGAGGAGLGISVGGLTSAGTGMIQAGMQAGTSMDIAQRQVQGRGESAISDLQTAGSIRDTNRTYGDFAARGDYANAIAGVQAKIQDARMLQPSVSGQFGGDAFNLINNKFGVSLRFKMVNLNALRTLGNYWLRYGYAINQFVQMPDSLHVMSKFTYWKLSETYISQGAFPEGFKQVIRGIFEKGVTVWKNPDDIGNTALADNQPLSGITY